MLSDPYKLINQLPRDFDMRRTRKRPLAQRQAAKAARQEMADRALRNELPTVVPEHTATNGTVIGIIVLFFVGILGVIAFTAEHLV